MYASAILLAAMGCCTVLCGATITTSVSCSLYGQATVSDTHSCNVEQESVPTLSGTAVASSYAGYGISGNALIVSFRQSGEIQEYGFPLLQFAQGNFTTAGSIDLSLQTEGSGTGLAEVLVESLGSIDPGGEEHGGLGLDLGGFSASCSYPSCYGVFPLYFGLAHLSTPFQMGSILDFRMSENFYAFVDANNPLSELSGTTTFKFLFTDGAGNPVDVSEVPEPGAAGLLIFGAIVAGLMVIVRRRLIKAPVSREPPYLSAGSVS
ncbi:MAG: PEP-CTERM sorting domain-containing protein [Terriglobia bacterium]